MDNNFWFISIGLGLLWLGLQIFWVSGLPRQLKSGETATAEKGSQKAFMLFWFDQYAWIGISLSVIGFIFVIFGAL